MATAAMTIYLALGFGIGIGLWLSELDEERERVLSEIGVDSLVMLAWPWVIWTRWRAQRQTRNFD